MSQPDGVYVTTANSTPPRSAPTDTGVAYLAGIFRKGRHTGVVTADDAILSMADFTRKLGARDPGSIDHDWAETFFREGGNRIYPTRVVGPAAAAASRDLAGTTGTTLTFTAASVGDWANGASGGLSIEVVNGPSGATHRQLILRLAGVEVARSPEFNDRVAAVDWQTDYGQVTLGAGSGLPIVAAAANLAGGTDDRAGITQARVDTALARLDEDLGPGQVVAPNWHTSAAHLSLAAHAASHNRFAVADPIDTTVKATLTAAGNALRGTADGSYLALVAPWLTIPATAPGGAGRAVPASALYCARAAVTDATDGPNQAPAGEYGIARYATGVRATFSRIDDPDGVNDAGDLKAAGVLLVISRYGEIRVYGNRTLVDPDGVERNLLQASNARYRMSLVARGRALGEPYVHRRITRHTINEFRKDLVGMLLGDYLRGDLFGDLDDDRPETAFNVDTDTVNDGTTAQEGRLLASVAYRPAKGAEMVQITITAAALTEPVA